MGVLTDIPPPFINRFKTNQIFMNTIQSFASLDLPPVQMAFAQHYDGTIGSILSFNRLPLVLNPCFTGHYFYVSGTTMENTVTTRDTDGSYTNWGKQSKEAENNAYLLSKVIKDMLKEYQLYLMPRADRQEYRQYTPAENWNKRKLFINLDGVMCRVPGLSTANINF